MNILEFEATLFELREKKYRHPEVDVIGQGFRPVSGKCADFTVVEHRGRYHFFYIERRLSKVRRSIQETRYISVMHPRQTFSTGRCTTL